MKVSGDAKEDRQLPMTALQRSPSDPQFAPERMWAAAVDQAIAESRCEGSGAACNIQTVFHRAGWAVVRHVASEPHVCRTCSPLATQEHLISAATLMHTDRRILARALAVWFDHFHPEPEDPATESGAASGSGLGLGVSRDADSASSPIACVHWRAAHRFDEAARHQELFNH